jgi:hypothetical protein
VALAVSGVAISLIVRVWPENNTLRIFHDICSRFALLIMIPYLLMQGRMPLDGYSRRFAWVTLVGWLALKTSSWLGAFVMGLTIRGYLIVAHVVLLVIATPLVVLHVVWALRPSVQRIARSETKPIAMSRVGTARLFSCAVAVGIIPTILCVAYPN